MAKFQGVIGFGINTEVRPGIHQDVITERNYYGDVIRNTVARNEADKVNKDLTVGNSISIVADAYAGTHFFAMRYIGWAGVLWSISEVEVQSPRLILRLGGVYNGPTAPASPDPV